MAVRIPPLSTISLWLFRLTAILIAYCGLVITIATWPLLAIVLLSVSVRAAVRRKNIPLTSHGTARWATEKDLTDARMFNVGGGLIIGSVYSRPRRLAAVRNMFRFKGDPAALCADLIASLRPKTNRYMRLNQAIHTLICAPSGAGKGVSILLPFLYDCADNCIVVDPQGALAKLTAEFRKRQFWHRIVLLDPYHVVTDSPDRFNPLDGILANYPHALDECRDLANALVVRPHDEKDPHWSQSAELWIAAFTALVVLHGDINGLRSLQTLRDLMSHPERLETAIRLMCESETWAGGMLARMGGQLKQFVDRERASVLSTAARHLRFLDTPSVAAITSSSSFDPTMINEGKVTIFLILPPDKLRAQTGLLRLWLASLLRTVVRGGLSQTRKVHFLLDEAAALQRFECLEDAIDQYRGYGVRLHFVYQSLGQLKKCFPEGGDQTLLSNTSQIFFGVNDPTTAEMVSTRLGEKTIIVESSGTSESTSEQISSSAQGEQTSSSTSWSSSRNLQPHARRLLKPEEVMALSPGTAIIFTPGTPPIMTRLVRYYEEPRLTAPPQASRFETWRTLVGAVYFCAVFIMAAYVLTNMLLHLLNR